MPRHLHIKFAPSSVRLYSNDYSLSFALARSADELAARRQRRCSGGSGQREIPTPMHTAIAETVSLRRSLDAARVITGSRKIKTVIARKSKIAESNCAWKWNPRLLLSPPWESFLDIGKRRETPCTKRELIDYKRIIHSLPRTRTYTSVRARAHTHIRTRARDHMIK